MNDDRESGKITLISVKGLGASASVLDPPRSIARPDTAALDGQVSTMSLLVRRAALVDEAALGELNALVQATHVNARPDVFVPVSAAAVAVWFHAVLDRAQCRAWLAELDGIPAGYLVAIIHDWPATPFATARRWCEIDRRSGSTGP